MSSILREPLNGESAVCPVPVETEMWIASPARAVDMLIHAMELPADAWGWNRTLNAPGITVSVAEALAALERAAGREAVRLVRSEPDAAIAKLVLSWPRALRDGTRGYSRLHMRCRHRGDRARASAGAGRECAIRGRCDVRSIGGKNGARRL